MDGSNQTIVRLVVNGTQVDLQIDVRRTLLDVLRENLALYGTKKGCDHGQCGACTVHIDGERRLSCLQLAALADGREILTIEGVAGEEGELHSVQRAFIDHDAMQCGYCTPGQIMSALAILAERGPLDESDLREKLSGNLCRCGAYEGVIKAVMEVANAKL